MSNRAHGGEVLVNVVDIFLCAFGVLQFFF